MNKSENNFSAPPGSLLGAHTSIAGGLWKAIERGAEIGCEAVQVFSKNQMQWKASPLKPEEIRKFKVAQKEKGVRAAMVHAGYLINLASPEPEKWEQSFRAFLVEIERCRDLEIPFLVIHPGAHMGAGEDAGMRRIVEAIDRALSELEWGEVILLLETTAGQGSGLGHRFEQLAQIREAVSQPNRVGVCLDTCHTFAAGYDIRTEEGLDETLQIFDRLIGLNHLKAFHLNDSKKPLGSRVDRHERIGQGEIGEAGFRALLKQPTLKNVPMILEIPGGDAAYATDLKLLKSWR
ncbi:MAG: deoxyribonuclease IV [Calditrichia bacterium]